MKKLIAGSTTIVLCVVLLLAGVFAGLWVAAQLRSMSADLDRMSDRVNTLTSMNSKLSVTNALLEQTNKSLSRMSAESASANEKLGRMQTDLAIMSHKLAGSFLFRGVK